MNGPEIVPIALPTPFRVGPVNVFLVKSTPLTLIDAGVNTGEAFEALRAAFKREALALSDLEVVLLTHTHIDHVGLLGRLRACADFTVYAHPDATHHRLNLEDNHDEAHRFALEIMREFGTPPDVIEKASAEQQTFRDYAADAAVDRGADEGQTVGPYTVCHVPGHSARDILFVNPRQRAAFTGDHVLATMTPNPLLRRPSPGQPRTRSLVQYRNSLRKTHALDLDVCYPGHGDPIRDHRAVIDSLFKRMDSRSARILALLGGSRCPSTKWPADSSRARMSRRCTFSSPPPWAISNCSKKKAGLPPNTGMAFCVFVRYNNRMRGKQER